MNDKTFLELAARAIGLEVYESTDGTMQNRPILVFSAGGGMGTMPYEEPYNPVINYTQLMMLVKVLKISIDFEDCYAWKRHYGKLIQEYWGGDYDPRFEHAIVRAAAALAEQGEK